MKKLSLLLAFSLLFLFSVTAQKNEEKSSEEKSNGKNWFIGAGVRGNVWVNDDANHYIKVWEKPSLGGEGFVGKWFSHKVGARLFLDGGSLHPFFQKLTWMEHERYVSGRVDFMLNFTNLFRSFSPDRFYNLIPYIGPGYAHSFDATNYPDINRTTNSFQVGGGLLNTFRLSNHWNLFINLGVDVMDAGFDGWKDNDAKLLKSPSKWDLLAAGSVGLIYNFGKTSKKEIVEPPIVVQEQQPAPKPEPKQEPQPQPQPKPQPEPVKVVEPVKPTLNNVFFRLDKSVIDPEQQVNVKTAADYLNANPNAKLNVIGYADVETGNPKYNMGLSERRAKAVAKELVNKYKINSNRLKLDWKGDKVQPFAVDEKNRVVMFVE